MGRGDKRTFKGKVFRGSFGKSRPRTDKKTTGLEGMSATSSTATTTQQQRKK
jgi:30S ribosomal protein S31